jgi:phosphatidylethanolamine-binding protein (PEBP) family uncharacterized protein
VARTTSGPPTPPNHTTNPQPSRAPRAMTNTTPPRTAHPRTPRAAALLSSILCLVALPLAAGCGEASTSSQQAAANTTTPNPATTASSPVTTAGNPTPDSQTTPGRHSSAPAKTRTHQALSSLANAKPAPKLPASQKAKLAVDDIELTSPSIHTQNGAPATLARENTCYGHDLTPALNWKTVPPGTAELAIFIISIKPVNNELHYDWAITGINPNLHNIPTNQTPPGTTTHTKYTICPPPHTNETYLTAIYALPHKLTTTPGTTPNQLHKQATHTAHHAGLLVSSYQTQTP